MAISYEKLADTLEEMAAFANNTLLDLAQTSIPATLFPSTLAIAYAFNEMGDRERGATQEELRIQREKFFKFVDMIERQTQVAAMVSIKRKV